MNAQPSFDIARQDRAFANPKVQLAEDVARYTASELQTARASGQNLGKVAFELSRTEDITKDPMLSRVGTVFTADEAGKPDRFVIQGTKLLDVANGTKPDADREYAASINRFRTGLEAAGELDSFREAAASYGAALDAQLAAKAPAPKRER